MRKLFNIILLLVVLGYIGYKLYQLPKFGTGENVPNFKTELVDGAAFELSDLRGDYVLIDFWGSWCEPCRKENPALVSLNKKFGNAPLRSGKDFHIVSIAIETKKERGIRAIEQDGLDWPHHIILLDRFKSSLAKTFGVREIPTKYLLGPEGNILAVNPSFAEIAEILNS